MATWYKDPSAAPRTLTYRQRNLARFLAMGCDPYEAWKDAGFKEPPGETISAKKKKVRIEIAALRTKPMFKETLEQFSKDIEENLCVNKAHELQKLIEIRDKVLQQVEPVYVYEKGKRVHKKDSQGNYVYQFDAQAAIQATNGIMRALGYYEPTPARRGSGQSLIQKLLGRKGVGDSEDNNMDALA